MKTYPSISNVLTSLSSSLLLSLLLSASPVNADVTAYNLAPVAVFHAPTEMQEVRSADTTGLQSEVLIKVNDALAHGVISPREASDLKDRINGWSNEESWYISGHKTVPQSVIDENTARLTALAEEVDKKQPSKAVGITADALHIKLDELISGALAKNKISSLQAERYYSRMAELESDMETVQRDGGTRSQEMAAVNDRLSTLEADIRTAAHM